MQKLTPKKITKSNVLIESGHRLGEVEQKIVLVAVYKARMSCKSIDELRDKEITIFADEYANYFNISKDKAYETLKIGILKLVKRQWTLKFLNDKSQIVYEYHNFLQMGGYIDGAGAVKLIFSNAMLPMLVELSKNFTTYHLDKVATLSSQYAIRFYEFFMQFMKNENSWLDITLEELRFRFGLKENEYKTMSNFKQFVLDYSVKEINKKTDIKVSYTQKKQGRKIVGFRFDFEYKDKKKILEEIECKEDKSFIENVEEYDEKEMEKTEIIEKEVQSEIKLLTSKQANMFSKLLSNDRDFHKFARTGEEQKDFTARIQRELMFEITKVEKYMSFLVKHGYNPNYKKSN